jgi:hypothetical protein
VPPEIDRRRGAQRVQLRRLGRQRRGEHHRDEQADGPVRELGQDEGDEDVVGVLGAGARIGRQERGLGVGANRLRPAMGRDHRGAARLFPDRVAGRAGL